MAKIFQKNFKHTSKNAPMAKPGLQKFCQATSRRLNAGGEPLIIPVFDSRGPKLTDLSQEDLRGYGTISLVVAEKRK